MLPVSVGLSRSEGNDVGVVSGGEVDCDLGGRIVTVHLNAAATDRKVASDVRNLSDTTTGNHARDYLAASRSGSRRLDTHGA